MPGLLMNKRRRWKAKARRRKVVRAMRILLLDKQNAQQFLREVYRPSNVYAANRRFEMMFPNSGMFEQSRGPRGAW